MSSRRLRIGILFVLCTFTSCTASIKSGHDTTFDVPPTIESNKDVVTKARQLYPPHQYLIGIGQADSEKAATELARADIGKQIRLELRVTWTDFLRERGGQTEQEVSRFVETQVAELVHGIEIVDQGRDATTGGAYAVVVMPKAEMERVLQGSRGQFEAAHKPQESPEQKDGVWVLAEGIVSLGDDTTVAEAKTRSRDEARRKAVEQAVGTFVKGQTVVYNAQVADDLVRSLVRGIVVEEQVMGEEVRQLGQETGAKALLYVTKLRAKVKPMQVERKGDFTVKATLNKSVFHDGDEMQIKAIPTRDAYLHFFNVGQDDTVTVLLPNRVSHTNFVRANAEFVFPDEDQRSLGIRLRAFPPSRATKATEKIKVIATVKPVDFQKGKVQEGVYRVYAGRDTALVTDLLRELSLLDDSEWAEVTVPYEVRK